MCNTDDDPPAYTGVVRSQRGRVVMATDDLRHVVSTRLGLASGEVLIPGISTNPLATIVRHGGVARHRSSATCSGRCGDGGTRPCAGEDVAAMGRRSASRSYGR